MKIFVKAKAGAKENKGTISGATSKRKIFEIQD